MRPMHTKIAAKTIFLAFALLLLCLAAASCRRRVHFTKQMTWECAPNEFNPAFYAKPDEYVRFRYVENPHYFELESSKICLC